MPQEVWRTVHSNARWVPGGGVCSLFLRLAVDDRKERARVELVFWDRIPAQLFLRSCTSRGFPSRGRLLTWECLSGRPPVPSRMAKHPLPARVVQAPNRAIQLQWFLLPALLNESNLEDCSDFGGDESAELPASRAVRTLFRGRAKLGYNPASIFWRTTQRLHAPAS